MPLQFKGNHMKKHTTLSTNPALHHFIALTMQKLLTPVTMMELNVIKDEIKHVTLSSIKKDSVVLSLSFSYNKLENPIFSILSKAISRANKFTLLVEQEITIRKDNTYLHLDFIFKNEDDIDLILETQNSEPENINLFDEYFEDLEFEFSQESKKRRDRRDLKKLRTWADKNNISAAILPRYL